MDILSECTRKDENTRQKVPGNGWLNRCKILKNNEIQHDQCAIYGHIICMYTNRQKQPTKVPDIGQLKSL